MSQPKKKMHLAQFLVHGPTYHSLAMWRHPRTAEANYEWSQAELYQHIETEAPDLMNDLVDTGNLSDDNKELLNKELKTFTEKFIDAL